jgi:molybdenum cofactor cytidylyltransferase
LISAIVLAAGKSERMGSPKALLPIYGRTFLENILDAISRTSIEETVVVVGHHRKEIEAALKLHSAERKRDSAQPQNAERKRDSAQPQNAERKRDSAQPQKLVFNPDYEKGMITSFQTGIRALSWDMSGAFLFLVDHPLVEPATIEPMIAHLAPNRIVLPTFEGRRGHPVLFSSEVLEEILALPSSEGANIVVRKDLDRIVEVPVNAPGILVDVDTPEQFEKLRGDYR